MERPIKLTPSRGKKSKAKTGTRQCIIHLETTPENDDVTHLTEHAFLKIKDVANERLLLQNPKQQLEHISVQLPNELDTSIHGIHRKCYQKYTNISKLVGKKRKIDVTNDVDHTSPSTSKRRRSTAATVLFPADRCLFCNKDTIKFKREKQGLVKCVTKCAEDSIKVAATQKQDEELLSKVQEQDLIAREAHYHNICRRHYTRNEARNVSHTDSMSSQSNAAHEDAFQYMCQYVHENIVLGQNVERLTMLRERYLSYLLENHQSVYNENYKTYKLKDKLIKHFGGKIRFWQPSYKGELVYAADVEGEAIEMAFELAASEERRLVECAMILRRLIFEEKQTSAGMPWPPSATWLLSDERKPPDMLTTFIVHVISGKSEKHMSRKTERYARSFAEDFCYAATNGEWAMPKHITLPMTVRHLTGSAEIITILNRYGHGQSYTKTTEVETAMCNAVTSTASVLPLEISTDNNAVLHLCWDNFDLNEETPSGSGTTHSTHGIVIQEVADRTRAIRVNLGECTERTGERTVKPREIDIRPCYAKPKVEPNLDLNQNEPTYDFTSANLLIFIWYVCRMIGSACDAQTVSSWSGWLTQTAGVKESGQSTVEYMTPLNVSINENSTVQHILDTSLAASHEVGQRYTIVTFDLAVAKKAYALLWQYPDRYKNVIVRMGVFHTLCSIFGTIGKMMKGSGITEIIIESGICASGSIEKVMSGKHFNRAVRVHKLVAEALERLLMSSFEEIHPRKEHLSSDATTAMNDLAASPSEPMLADVLQSEEIQIYFASYYDYKEAIRGGKFGKTAQFWMKYMDIIQLTLLLIRATKENDLDLHVASLYHLCPLFFAFDHINYARYVPVYLTTLMNLDRTHPGAIALLNNNGFSVSRSSVPKSRNPVDMTIEQTINRHAKCQGGIIGFSRNYPAYYRWCLTRHCRAQYVEATLQMTDMTSAETFVHKELQPSQIKASEQSVQKVVEAFGNFTDPFLTAKEDTLLYCLSSGVPASTVVTEDLLNAQATGKTAMEEFIATRLHDKTVPFHNPIKRRKLKTFALSEVKKTVKSAQNKFAQVKAERNIFGQLVILAAQNNIDLELTLSYPLGPVPWSLATADGMPVKTDKAKLLHNLEAGVETTSSRPREHVVSIHDGNALLQSMPFAPTTFEDLAEITFNLLPNDNRVDFVTDTYISASIKSFERNRRGTTPTFLISGPKTKTPKDWKGFMANDDNKTQLLHLLFEQWKSDKYAKKLQGRELFYALGDKCYRLTSNDGESVIAIPEESLFTTQEEADTRMILHCLHVRDAKPESMIVVRSPDTDVLVLLTRYAKDIDRDILFDTGVGNKRRLLSVNKIHESKGEEICSILPAVHCFTGCDTTSAFVRRGKTAPLKLVEKHPPYVETFQLLGSGVECSNKMISSFEQFVCHMYGQPSYSNVNKLRFDTFSKKNQINGDTLNSCNGIDMSLLPPCRASLEMHVRRVNYQVFVWIHSHEQFPDLPSVETSGWRKQESGCIEFDWVNGSIVPQELADILCNSPSCDSDGSIDDEDETNRELDIDENDMELVNMIDFVFEDGE